jgi:hypothetical protein
LAVGRNELMVLYKDFKDDRRDFENLDGPPWERPFALVLARSSDGGATFSPGIEVDSEVVPTRRFLVFLPEFPSLAAGSDRTLYVTWSDGRNGDEDVFVRRSTDDGTSWSAAVRINDNPRGDGTSQYLPRVAVAPEGRVDVLFFDRRRDSANQRTDAYLALSWDRGKSFSNLRLSERSFDARTGPDTGGRWPIDLGSRLGLVSDQDDAVAAWTDTRLGTELSGRQDIVTARVEIRSRSGAWRAIPTMAVALFGAGTVLLVLARGQGKSDPSEGEGVGRAFANT